MQRERESLVHLNQLTGLFCMHTKIKAIPLIAPLLGELLALTSVDLLSSLEITLTFKLSTDPAAAAAAYLHMYMAGSSSLPNLL